MKKILLTVLLIAILILGLFVLTGCGENKEEKKEEESKNETKTSQTINNDEALTPEKQEGEIVEFYIQNLIPDTTIKELSVAKADSNEFTANLLGELELENEKQAKIGLGMKEDSATFDFKITDKEGKKSEIKAVNLTSVFVSKGGIVALQKDEEGNLIAAIR